MEQIFSCIECHGLTPWPMNMGGGPSKCIKCEAGPEKLIIRAPGDLSASFIETYPTLKEVRAVFGKWLHLADPQRIDINLAVTASARFPGDPLWLINIFNSGQAKTELSRAIHGGDAYAQLAKGQRYRILRLTSRTLVSGRGNEQSDLAPRLNGKAIFIFDMATLLNLPYEEKLAIYSQLRDLYDGFAGLDSGNGRNAKYEKIHTSLIGNSTTAIDSQAAMMHALGTRELFLRAGEGEEGIIADIKQMAWDNEGAEETMRTELAGICHNFLQGVGPLWAGKITEEVKTELFALADYLCIMRAPAEFDQDGGLRAKIECEAPTRVLKQLRRLFVMLKTIDPEYTDANALKAVRKVVHSSVDKLRADVLAYYVAQAKKGNTNDFATYEVAEGMKIGRKSATMHTNALVNLDLVLSRMEKTTDKYGQFHFQSFYRVNMDHPLVKTRFQKQGVLA